MHRRAQMRGAGMGIAELRGPDVDAMRLRPGKIACQRQEARSDSTAEFQQALRREIREAMKQIRRGGVPAPIVNQAAVATQHIDRAAAIHQRALREAAVVAPLSATGTASRRASVCQYVRIRSRTVLLNQY